MADLKDDPDTLRTRLHRAIPGGAHTYSRGDDQHPSNAPALLVRGRGPYVWDADDRRYLDYGMALRAVTLGYADPRVNAAAFAEMERGVNLTRASRTELDAAEAMISMFPSVEMVKFGKNGSNVTTAAVKIARAFTGRRYVCVPRQQPFFSFDDWFIGTTAMNRGIPSEHFATTLLFDYGDLTSLRRLFAEHPGEIAAVMLEPATTMIPCGTSCDGPNHWPRQSCAECPNNRGNFLHAVRALCDTHSALLILDEMITGFRWHVGGAQAFFGVEPDLCTFGKGMANGFSVSAVGGRRDVMQVGSIDQPDMERTFLLSTTHGAEMPGLGAFIETARIYRTEDVCGHLWSYGAQFRRVFEAATARHGLTQHVALDGPDICLSYITRDASGSSSLEFRTLFAQEMVKRGVMIPWIAISQSHGDAELAITAEALDGALGVYREALDKGIGYFLVGPAIRPVFRVRN